jgi:hypothetical protein
VPHSIVVVTGPAASGKTRLLEAIVAGKEGVAPYATMLAPEAMLRTPGDTAKIALGWYLNEEEMRFAGVSNPLQPTEAIFDEEGVHADGEEGVLALLERYAHDERFGKIEYFPWSRDVAPFGASHGLSPIEQRVLRPGRDPRKYSFVPRFLGSLPTDRAAAERFTAHLGRLSSTVAYAPQGGSEPWKSLRSSGRGLPDRAVDVTELSSSEVDAVIFAATAALVRLDRSVVLVDRPALHVEPSARAAYLAALAARGADAQHVVATTSPEMLAAVEPAQIVRLA